MTKKKGKTPTLISGSSGRPAQTFAQRSRICSRCSFNISSGEVCYEIPKVGRGFSNKKTFCVNCFKEILVQTKNDIFNLEKDL